MTVPRIHETTMEAGSKSTEDDISSRVESAIAAFRRGEAIVIVDDEPDGFGVVVTAAEKVAQEQIAFMIRWGSGIISVPLRTERLNELELPMMVPHGRDQHRSAFTISVDARVGVTTGISAADRWRTIKTLIDRDTAPSDLTRPGHVYPVRYLPGGVLRRPGHAEAAVDLTNLACLYPAAVLTEMMDDKGSHLRTDDLARFAEAQGLAMISLADLISYRRRRERLVERVFESELLRGGVVYRAVCYRSLLDYSEHLVFTLGDVDFQRDPVLVAVHSECLAGDVFGAESCRCGPSLNRAFAMIERARRGALLYVRPGDTGCSVPQEGVGLHCDREDDVAQNDLRDNGIAAQILQDLGIRAVLLLTNQPAESGFIDVHGLTIVGSTPLVELEKPRIDVHEQPGGTSSSDSARAVVHPSHPTS